MLPDSGDSVPANARPFHLPRSVPRSAPQTSTTNIQNSEPGHVNLVANTNYVDSLDQEAYDPIVDSSAQRRKKHKTTEFWAVKIIDSDGTIKPARLSVREAMEWPNGRKIVLRFNNAKQAIGDEAGLLSGMLVSNCPLSLMDQQEKCRKSASNRSKQLYTHTGGSKSFAWRMEEEERIEEIEQQDESSRLLSQNDCIAQWRF
ncbi:hypothetical protein Ahy_B08g092473 [Arachis hypogaea]|uniref:Uncharacterized protein n=1 Tax=Arachis hypogaea TaxID=3818 RepID=A0A444Y3Z0_ARAHY|nr:hypothetical protein Ahy_B08g092473 [Arachis hypogaea]